MAQPTAEPSGHMMKMLDSAVQELQELSFATALPIADMSWALPADWFQEIVTNAPAGTPSPSPSPLAPPKATPSAYTAPGGERIDEAVVKGSFSEPPADPADPGDAYIFDPLAKPAVFTRHLNPETASAAKIEDAPTRTPVEEAGRVQSIRMPKDVVFEAPAQMTVSLQTEGASIYNDLPFADLDLPPDLPPGMELVAPLVSTAPGMPTRVQQSVQQSQTAAPPARVVAPDPEPEQGRPDATPPPKPVAAPVSAAAVEGPMRDGDGDGAYSPGEIMASLDSDGDGRLATGEVAAVLGGDFAGLADAGGDGEVTLGELARLADISRDQVVTPEEVLVVSREMALKARPEELAILRGQLEPGQLMAYLDANHDGAVAFPEVARACKSRIIADVLDPNDDNAYDEAEVLDKVDYNRDKSTSASEIARVFENAADVAAYKVMEVIDRSKDGFASMAELKAAFPVLEKVSPAFLALIDTNRDGNLKFEEVARALDFNGTGHIIHAEIVKLVMENAADPWAEMRASIEDPNEAYGKGDEITVKAFQDKVLGAYDAYDKEKLGQMKLIKIAMLLERELHLGQFTEELHAYYPLFDPSQDGWVSKGEFLERMQAFYEEGNMFPLLKPAPSGSTRTVNEVPQAESSEEGYDLYEAVVVDPPMAAAGGGGGEFAAEGGAPWAEGDADAAAEPWDTEL